MPAHSNRGFTLIELMVTVVIAGIVVGIIFEFLLGQGRFARFQTAREEVQQNARVALDVISSDLRGVGPQGITDATSNSITFRAPRAWGVACRHSGSELAVIFPMAAVPALRTGADRLAVGTTFHGDVVDATGDGAAAADICNTTVVPSPPAVAADKRARVFTNVVTTSPLQPRQDVYVYDEIKYDVSTSSGMPGYWIRRRSQPNGTPQPLAGPLPSTTGLEFAYEDAAGNPTATRDDIARIRVKVTTSSRAKFNGRAQDDTDWTTIYLRNR